MSNHFYITTPIYYVNARPHLGHAYTTIIADVTCRFNTMRGFDTFFLTGTDEHGDKIVKAAVKENLSPKKYVDKISALFRDIWPELNIGYHKFIRTTDPDHIMVVKQVLQKIYDSGDIYFSEYEGMYCYGCERFYTEHELVDGMCPDHQTKPERIKESNYFFKMSRYQGWLIEHIQRHPTFIQPERYRNEVLSFLKEPLEDLCISRPKSRLRWGITLPFDADYVTYVWFDALLNYISAIGYPDGELYQQFWSSANHIVAKDILKPHGIYWPTMLKAAGIPVYQHLNVHGYWNIDESKMSKSLGNVVEPLQLAKLYGLDAFRFFLLRDMSFGLDSSFSEDAMVQRINSDLANDLGNLFSRVLSMAHKYFDGTVPAAERELEGELEKQLESGAEKMIHEYEAAMTSFQFHKALMVIWNFIGLLNKYIDVMAPWVLAKKKTHRKQLEIVIYNLLEGLRVISGLIYPVMPDTAMTMQKHLGFGSDADEPFYRLAFLKKWKTIKAGTKLKKAIRLFPRIEIKKTPPHASNTEKNQEAISGVKPEITIDDFSKIDLRVATVIDAKAVPRAKKLIQLDIDAGGRRTIIAGIATRYAPDDLIGKQVIVVANLKPAKIMGLISNGMLLAAVDKEDVTILTTDGKIKPGTPIR